MSLQNCVTEAKQWAKDHAELKLRPSEIEDLGRLLQAAHDAGSTPAERMKLMQDAVTRRIELTQEANRGEAYLNTVKHAQNLMNLQKNAELWGNTPNSMADALEALTTGKSSRPGFGVNNDPLAASRANTARYLGFLENSLSKPELKLLKALAPGDDMTKKILQELDALRSGTQLGQSGSDLALSIAKKFREAQDAVFKEAQAVNPCLRENTLYLFTRSHLRDRIAQVGEDEWVGDAKAAFGNNLVGEPTQIDKFLRETYKSILSGLPPEATDMTPRFWEPPGTGGSQALQSAGQRVFIANSWESEFNYNAKYGDSLYNAFVKQAQRQADYVGTVNKWGTRAADAFQRMWNAAYKMADTPEQKAALMRRKADLQEKFDSTQGSRYNEAWTVSARLAQGLEAAENLSMLGNHVPRTLSAGPAMLTQLRDGFGMNIFERATALARGFGSVVAHLPDGGKAEMRKLSIMSMSVGRDMANQIARGNFEPQTQGFLGQVGKLSRLAGKLTLADWTTNAYKFAHAVNDTHMLGEMADKPFGQLPAQTQEMLHRYDLGGPRWEVMRHALDSNGRMVPEALRGVPDEIVNQVSYGSKTSSSESQRIRGELAQNLGTLLNDRASMTVAESNSDSRATAYGTSDMNAPGQAGRNAIARNWFYQFKQASLVRQQLLQRTFRSGGGNTSNISGTLSYMLQMAFMGAMGQQLVEMGAGREPLDMKDPKIVSHMIESTGLLGFYGDILADFVTSPEPDKMKRMVEGDFLGPSFGAVEKIGEVTYRTGKGAFQYAQGKERPNQYGGAQWARLIHSLTPNQNLFYAKGALDYTLFNEAHEFMGDRGYIGTLRKQMEQHQSLLGGRQHFYGLGGENAFQ